MRVSRPSCLLGLASILLSTLALAQPADRITQPINGSQMVRLTANTHAPIWPGSDVGRVDGNRPMYGVRLAFGMSATQQKDLDLLLAQLQDRKSPDYRKFLTTAQYAQRFGLSHNDIDRVAAWLQSEGFTNVSVNPSHNEFSFDGSVAQIEQVFKTEMHAYLADGEVHMANSEVPSVPAALAGMVLGMRHLHNFPPKPHIRVQPHFTSYVSGNHYLTPGDFGTIYNVNGLYSAGSKGTGQKIAIVGQSTVDTVYNDLANFRSAAGLPANAPTLTLIEGTATRCSGDEGESDLDLEWAGGVAPNASIIFLYAGLGPGDTCQARFDSVWDAMHDALTTSPVIAPFVSTSYGFCEQLLQEEELGFPAMVEGWAQEGQGLGISMVSASGDAGAADCDPDTSSAASGGLAVDVPASIPEVTGAGGNEFTGDVAGAVTGTPPNTTAGADDPYWSGSGTGTDTISSALEYIPEEAWNDTTENGRLSASGGGASTLFPKPTWQTGTGVPNDGDRDVPDIAITTSPDHDPYLFCSEDNGDGGIVATCTNGFRTGTGGDLTAVGGTSAAAPTFTAILALVNEYIGAPANGLVPVNPMLYQFAASSSSPFHDVTTGNNIVPCTQGTPNCPATAPFQFGYTAGVGYDQVTGLGSVNAFALATSWAGTIGSFTLAASPTTLTAVAGQNTGSTTITITPANGFSGTVNFTCSSGLPTGATCNFTPVNSTSSTLVIETAANMAAVSNVAVTIKGSNSTGAISNTTTVNLTVTATTESFTLTSNLGSSGQLQVAQGASGVVTFTVCGTNGFVSGSSSCPPPTNSTTVLPVTYTCSGAPSETTCLGASTPTTQTSVSFTIQTTAPSARLERPFDRGTRIFYAALFPGLLGIMFTLGSRKRALGGMRLLGLIVVLGFSTLWLGSCSNSNSSSSSNPGTPVGTSTITINATTGGANPITSSATFTLNVVAQ